MSSTIVPACQPPPQYGIQFRPAAGFDNRRERRAGRCGTAEPGRSVSARFIVTRRNVHGTATQHRANHSRCQALDRQLLLAQIDLDRRVSGDSQARAGRAAPAAGSTSPSLHRRCVRRRSGHCEPASCDARPADRDRGCRRLSCCRRGPAGNRRLVETAPDRRPRSLRCWMRRESARSAIQPSSGNSTGAASDRRIPREIPGISSIAPFAASARRCLIDPAGPSAAALRRSPARRGRPLLHEAADKGQHLQPFGVIRHERTQCQTDVWYRVSGASAAYHAQCTRRNPCPNPGAPVRA